MPGKRGRSKACATCRQRRIGCDLKVPSCSQCNKSGLDCPGYSTGPVFVFHNPGSKGRLIRDNDKLETSEAESDPGPSTPRSTGAAQSVELQWTPPIQDLTPLVECRRQIYHQHVASSVVFVDQINDDCPKPWFFLWPQTTNPTKAFEVSMAALTASSLGIEKNDENLKAQGDRAYGKALMELQTALSKPSLARNDHTLAACMALLHNEILACPDDMRRGYDSHRAGASQLIQLRKPSAYSAPFLHEIFFTFRILEMLHTLQNLVPSFLSQPRWRDDPWIGRKKSNYDRTLDLYFEMADWFKVSKMVLNTSELKMANAVHKLCDEYEKIHQKLRLEHDRVVATVDGPAYWLQPAQPGGPLDKITKDNIYPMAYRFANFTVARDLMLIWTGIAVTLSARCQQHKILELLIDQDIPHAQDLSVKCSMDEIYDEWTTAIDNACQCVEFFLQPPVQSFTRMLLSVPLQILWGNTDMDERYQRQQDWVNDINLSLAESGMRLLRLPLTAP